MLFYLLIIFFFLLAIHCSIRYTRTGRMVDKIPGPTSIPILGNLLQLNLTPEQLWNYNCKQHTINSISRVWLGTYAMISTANPDDLKIILSCKTNIKKANFYKNFESIVKRGLVNSSGEYWRQHRKILAPAFNTNILKVYTQIANEHTETMIEHIKSQGEESIENLKPLLAKLSLNIICEAAMNININDLGSEVEQKIREAVDDFLEIFSYRLSRPYITDWVMKFLNIGRKQERAFEIFRQFIKKIIEERKKYFEYTGYKSYSSFVDNDDLTTGVEHGKQKRSVLIDLLLSAQNDGIIDEEEVQDEVSTFIVAGYDTVSVSLASIFMLLAENKKEQDMARAEAVKILGNNGGNVTIKEINQMDYISRCIKESLRILPSVPNVGRNAVKEIQLKNYTVPVGQEILCCIYNVHHNPKLWPDPEKFDPDRFLPENLKSHHPFTYLPFSSGPRNCIGQRFAMMELTVAVARVLCNFYLEPVAKTADLKFKYGVILATTQSMRVKFVKINKNDF